MTTKTTTMRDQLEGRGFTDPIPLLAQTDAHAAADRIERAWAATPVLTQNLRLESTWRDLGVRTAWFKSVHAYVPEVASLAAHPTIVSAVTAELGPDVLCWGAQFVVRKPDTGQRWHIDVEHDRWPGVSVWLGLRDATPTSGVRYITHTAKAPTSPQHLAKMGMNIHDDAAMLRVAQVHDPRASIASTAVQDGEFYLFAGRIWHGSRNKSPLRRVALIFQYCRPDAEVRVPLPPWDPPWPFHPTFQPPCQLVAGRDTAGKNAVFRV